MDVIAFPFRLTSTKEVALVVQGSDAHLAQQAYQFVQTRPRQLPLAPTYGIEDPVFRVVGRGEIIVGLARFHPDIKVEAVIIDASDNDGTTYIGVEFSQKATAATTNQTEVIFGA